MTFKELPIGAAFEFDHSDLPVSCGELAHGPWRRMSSHQYAIKIGDEIPARKHWHTVGSVNLKVRTDCDCANKHGGYRGMLGRHL